MAANPYQKYKDTKYETASSEQLLLMLYRGGIKFAQQAEKKLKEEDYEAANYKLQRAQEVINELMVTLDMDQGGEIAENLYNLYDYMKRQLVQANIKKDPDIVQEVVDLLSELLEGWKGAVKKVKQGKVQGQKQTGEINVEG